MRPDVLLDRAARKIEQVWASSLTRVLLLVGRRDSNENNVELDSPFAIISAFQSNAGIDDNIQRTKELEDMLDRAGIKSYRLNGAWLEPPKGSSFEDASVDQTMIKIKETALFCVPKSGTSFDDFETALIRQGDRFGQEGIIIGSGEAPPERVHSASSAWIRFKNGRIKSLPESLSVAVLEEAYKEMRNQKEHPFTFE